MAFNVKTFYTRATTALVFVALLLGCVWYSFYSFFLFFGIVGLIGLYEFYKISERLNTRPYKIIAYLLYTLIIATVFIDAYNESQEFKYLRLVSSFSVFLLPFILFIMELFKKENSINNIAYTIMGLIYVLIPCVFIVLIVNYNKYTIFNPNPVLGMIFFVWINDTGAYLVGSFFGKHKLFERISPNKTWEGTLGGIALCIALSFVVAQMFPQLAPIHWVVISIIVAVFGNLGDLVESMLKRMAGVKDSGNLMPGHGGVLDRFDSLFFATPFVFCYLALMGLL
jgi:phosphatidate cytidylyltransferase